MKLQGIGIRSLAAVARDPRRSTSERERCLGLGAECTKASAAASGRRKMSLDIPFYRTSEKRSQPVARPPGLAAGRYSAIPASYRHTIAWSCPLLDHRRAGSTKTNGCCCPCRPHANEAYEKRHFPN